MSHSVNSRLGFALPEVCVALAVFLVGTTGLIACWNYFNREIADERYRLEQFYDVESAMERLIAVKPLCSDSLDVPNVAGPESRIVTDSRNLEIVRLKRIPGNARLAWATVVRDNFSLKRLVRCR